jgi:hypothetical protein
MKKLILFIIPIFIGISKLYPQACCTVGTSISSGVERGVVPHKHFSIAGSFQNNVLNDAYQSSENIEDPLNRKATVTDFFIELEYGLAEQVSILITGGYTNKSRTTTVFDLVTNSSDEFTFTGNGFTDLVVLGKYQIIVPNIISPFGLSAGGGAKLPTGSYQQDNDGTRLSIDLQPGTGATDLLFWAHSSYAIPSNSLAFNLNALYRYAGVNLDGYRYGDEFITSINGTYGIVDFLAINLQVKGRFSDKDYWNGRFLPSTGGTYIDLIPSLVYVEGAFNLRILAQVPVYRDVQGIQLTVSEKLGVELRYTFDLN